MNIRHNINPKRISPYEEMKHFFKVYKELEGKETAVNEVSGHENAEKIIAQAIDGYIDNYCK